MDKFGVQLRLEKLAEEYAKWQAVKRQADNAYATHMKRLIIETAQARMSVEQVARAAGLTTRRVRSLMAESGLDANASAGLLAKQTAEAIQKNAVLMGIDPADMDLMSPLAYLPAGKAMRDKFAEEPTAPEPTEVMMDAFRAAWHKADCEGRTGERVRDGLRAALAVKP